MPKSRRRKTAVNAAATSTSGNKLSCCKPFTILGRCLLIFVGCTLCVLLGMEWENRNLLMRVQHQKILPLQQVAAEHSSVSSYPKIEYSVEKPIFSLSLPNTGMPILPRYFECASEQRGKQQHYDESFGRYWTTNDPKSPTRQPIGRCFHNNIKWPNNKNNQNNNDAAAAATANNNNTTTSSILEGCGNFEIWHDLQYRQAPPPLNNPSTQGYCFDVVLYEGALQRLYEAKPNATIILQIKEPQLWYKTLSYDLHRHWSEWCNPIHNNLFPTEQTEEAYLEFYHSYHQRIRDFINSPNHSGWTLIEIDMSSDDNHKAIASRLQQQLGIDSKCWMDSVQGNIPLLFGGGQQQQNNNQSTTSDNNFGAITASLPRPNDITYPILVAGLPKSGTGTTDVFFDCSLGKFMSAHQWTFHNLEVNQTVGVSIGECMKSNIGNGTAPLLHNCGNARVYCDIGIFNPNDNKCYYPTLHGGLEHFAKSYPYATILLAIRSSKSWTKSIEKWANLKERWANGQDSCPNTFPPVNSPASKWEEFYDRHTQSIRDFVKQHPTLTYIEVPMTDDTGLIFSNVFGFHKSCFPGHHNVNIGDAMPAFKGLKKENPT